MNDDQIARLLHGYRLPEVSLQLDNRVLSEGAAILKRSGAQLTAGDVVRVLLERLGFGYVIWFVDFTAGSDATYRVNLI